MAQPRSVARVVGQVVAGQAMHQHVQAAPVLLQPRNHLVERGAVECQLAAPVRMRPDLAFMHPAHRDRKPPARLLAQRFGLRQRRGSEVNVGMVVVVEVLRALGHGQQVQLNPWKTSPIQTRPSRRLQAGG